MNGQHLNLRKQSRGFTMIELIMMITIMAFLSIMVVTRTLQPSQYQKVHAARKMVSDIQYAQVLAMSTARRCGVSFNVGGNSYTVFIGSPATPVTDPVSRTNYIVQYGAGSYSNVNITDANFGGTATLYFDSRGRPYNGSGTALAVDGLVVLNSSTNITVARETGFTSSV